MFTVKLDEIMSGILRGQERQFTSLKQFRQECDRLLLTWALTAGYSDHHIARMVGARKQTIWNLRRRLGIPSARALRQGKCLKLPVVERSPFFATR